ncbi:SET and MYND domain-containing protein DDB_G0273589-like [Chironomus tepperi]|uniref:SET and MYND domain-containing protein DDB_G0273589-like n=1 Tax=Chironomus tepperi TaxID=113505 RepID=UPI00391EEEB2
MNITDAYDFTDILRQKLIESGNIVELSKEFNNIKDNSERVKFLERLLLEYNLIPKAEDFKRPKNDAISKDFRDKGNKFYSNRHYIEALENYNISLCFAEENGENIGIGFANRSAIYCEIKYYSRALKNIDMAISNNYPQKNIDKLMKRAELCKSHINDDREKSAYSTIGEEFLKLSHEPNPKLPFVAKCLELKSDDQFGRYLVTNKRLSAGDIIAIEEPFSKCVLPSSSYRYCANCLSDNFLDLLPCKFCSAVMFCSEECREIGINKFHKYECNIIDALNAIYTKIMRISSHTFFEALNVYNSDLQQLKSAMDENANASVTVYDFDWESESNNDVTGLDVKKKMFLAIDSLVTNEKHRSPSDLFQRAGIVAIMTNLLLSQTELKKLLPTDNDKSFFRQFIMKQTQIAALNYHGLFDGILTKSQLNDNVQCGSASYPFCSLINHSCEPNLVRVSHKYKNYVVVNRLIEAGEQLFDNYGYHHCLESLRERQTSLNSQYMFKCTCAACRHDYKLFPQLKNATSTFDNFLGNDVTELQNLNMDTAQRRLKDYCKMINKLDRHYPCREISSLQECLLRCFFIFKLSTFNLELLKHY